MQLTYDSLSRITGETQGPNPLGSSGKTVSYTYDAEGNRTKIDYPDGFGGSAFDANESRDALGRLSSVTDGGSNQIAAFDLYGAGARKKKVTLANSTTANYAWDGFRRPTDIDHKDSGGTRFAGFAYAWDKSDNPLMEARSHKSGKGDVYSYDRANRLIKTLRDVDDPAAELASPGTEVYDKKLDYAMDDVLNLTSYTVTPYGGSASSTSYTTNAMNEYTAVGGVTHTYTDNGALAGDGTYTYKYDGRDRLIEVKQGTTTVATYAYDALGLGRRTKKTVGSATTKYLYAGQQSIEETDGSGTLLRLFVFGDRIDEILAMDAPDQADVDGDSNTSEVLRFAYHTQLIGSVTHVTAPSGALAEQYEYDPYGKVTIKDGSGGTLTASAIGNAYTFTARQLDEETGLYYYRARTYSADLRRFIQRDPLEYVDGPNTLGYCGGQATRSTDPSGLTTTHEKSPEGNNVTIIKIKLIREKDLPKLPPVDEKKNDGTKKTDEEIENEEDAAKEAQRKKAREANEKKIRDAMEAEAARRKKSGGADGPAPEKDDIDTTVRQLLNEGRDGWTWFSGPGSSISVVDESSRPGDDAGKNKRLVDHELGHVDVFEKLYKAICGGSGAGAGIDKTAWEAAVTVANDQYHKGPKDGGVGDDGAPSDAAKKKAVQAGVDAYNKVMKKP